MDGAWYGLPEVVALHHAHDIYEFLLSILTCRQYFAVSYFIENMQVFSGVTGNNDIDHAFSDFMSLFKSLLPIDVMPLAAYNEL